MYLSKKAAFAAILLLVSFVTGCASVPMASSEMDEQAKTFAVPPGKSSIYVYRNETFGGAVRMTVELDGKVAGQSGPKTYFLFVVPPGAHEVKSVAENTSAIKMQTEAGKAYFVWQEAKLGLLYAGTQLHLVDEATGRKGVAECKEAKSEL